MTYKEDHYTPSGNQTQPVGAKPTSGGSPWGLAVGLVVLLGLLGLAMMVGPADQRGSDATAEAGAPLIEQETPAAPAQPQD